MTSCKYPDIKCDDLLITDYPGESSPPPGIPLFSTPKDLKDYLVNSDVDYIIFQYHGLFDKTSFGYRLDASSNPWLRIEAENAFAFQDKILKLAETNVVLYRDDTYIVINLI